MSNPISQYLRAVEERKRVYLDPMDPLQIQQIKLELGKLRVQLANTKMQQNTEFINKYGTVMAAQQGAKDRIIVAAIAAQAGMSKAQKFNKH